MLALISRAFRRVEQPQSRRFSVSSLLRGFAPLLGARSAVGECVQHVGTLPLTTQSSLAVVRFNNETLLIGITSQTMTVLAKTAGDNNPGANAATQMPSRAMDTTPFADHQAGGAGENPIV